MTRFDNDTGDVATRKKTAPLPKLERKEGGILNVQATSEDTLRLIFGVETSEMVDGLLLQCVNALNGAATAKPDFMIAAVKEIGPRDGVEAMLATQMAAVHIAMMTFARRLAQVETIPQQDSAEKAFNKLARTYVAQVEALKRYRTGGEQKVSVQRVTVNQGGQAVVGNVSRSAGGRGAKKK